MIGRARIGANWILSAGVALSALPVAAGPLSDALVSMRPAHRQDLRAWLASHPQSGADSGGDPTPETAALAEAETRSIVEPGAGVGASVRLRLFVEGFLPAADFDLPPLSARQEAWIERIATVVHQACGSGETCAIRVRGSTDGPLCTGDCHDQVVLGRVAGPTARNHVARSRATVVANRLRARLPDVAVEETAESEAFPVAGVEFRRAVVEVVRVDPGRPGDGCRGLCDALGRDAAPGGRTGGARAALLAGASGGYLSGPLLAVEAGVAVLSRSLEFRLGLGGLWGPGDTRAGYLLRGRLFLPALLPGGGRWVPGIGVATVTTGETFAATPAVTKQHYLAEIVFAWRPVRGARSTLGVEATGMLGLGRQAFQTITGTRIVEQRENRFTGGGTLGVAWTFE
jgi:hypothetical protein